MPVRIVPGQIGVACVGLFARRGGGSIDFGFSGRSAHEQQKVTHLAATAISQRGVCPLMEGVLRLGADRRPSSRHRTLTIKEGKYALKWTLLSCRRFRDNQTRLPLFALAYNPGNFLRQLALSREVKPLSLTTLREKLIKIGSACSRTRGESACRPAGRSLPPRRPRRHRNSRSRMRSRPHSHGWRAGTTGLTRRAGRGPC